HRGFVYQHARFGPDKKSIEVGRTTARRLGGSLLGLPQAGAGLRSSARAVLRVHSSVGVSGFFAVPHAARRVPYLWRGGRGGCLERWKTSVHQSTHVLPGGLGAQTLLEGDR